MKFNIMNKSAIMYGNKLKVSTLTRIVIFYICR